MQLGTHHSPKDETQNEPVLVVESDDAVRRLLVSQVERMGMRCYSAPDLEVAMGLLEADERVFWVLIELSQPGDAMAQWVAAVKRMRPGVTVVGLGGEGSEPDLLAQGVDRVMAKPWRISDLVESLSS